MSGALARPEVSPAPPSGGQVVRLAASAAIGRRQPFGHVPTHAIGVRDERRGHARAYLCLPLRMTTVDAQPEPISVTLLTRNISSSGVCFLSPRRIEPGVRIELEVALVERPLGKGSVRMATAAQVVRTEPAGTPGWHSIAVRFEDFDFRRDEALPRRFRQP